MGDFVILGVWMSLGLVAAAATAGRDEARLAWWPFAVVFGPLWVVVAGDQQATDPAVGSTEERTDGW